MNPKTILTEDGWDEAAPDCKGKDRDFLKALSGYESLDQEEFDQRSRALGRITTLATSLKGCDEVKGDKEAVKYLTDVINASKAGQSEVAKAKGQAQKKAAEEAKKSALAAKEKEKEKEKDDETGDALTKLTTALNNLKIARKSYYFLACDARPYGFVLSKKDIRKNYEARKELSKLSGGSTRPPKVGECRFEGGKYILDMDKPPSGLARVLQKWIKDTTGLNVKLMVGTESGDDAPGGDDDGPAVA